MGKNNHCENETITKRRVKKKEGIKAEHT